MSTVSAPLATAVCRAPGKHALCQRRSTYAPTQVALLRNYINGLSALVASLKSALKSASSSSSSRAQPGGAAQVWAALLLGQCWCHIRSRHLVLTAA